MAIVERIADRGMIGMGPYEHAYGIMALVATGMPVPEAAIEAARGSQIEDGAWAFDGTMEPGAGDTNTTAMMVQALVAAGSHDEMVARAQAYLLGAQNGMVDFPISRRRIGREFDRARVQALIALNDPPTPKRRRMRDGAARFAKRGRCVFLYGIHPDDNAFATVQEFGACGRSHSMAKRRSESTVDPTPRDNGEFQRPRKRGDRDRSGLDGAGEESPALDAARCIVTAASRSWRGCWRSADPAGGGRFHPGQRSETGGPTRGSSSARGTAR